MARNPSELTPKQARFVEEYLVDFNATQAYIRAGYATHADMGVVNSNASILLDNQKVAAALAERRAELSKRTGITQERVLREYARIAFADIRSYATVQNGAVVTRNSEDWSDDDAAAVAEVGQTVTKDGGSLRFKLHSKTDALDSLARMLGMYPEKEKPGDTNIQLTQLNITVKYDYTEPRH